ncbi:hypothetical protein BASA81_001086 [Batrachochytrium salamandrivorans]|nr:hypothetical protein BASA81_001086 [Batrachochytrium salamandrivorans]
MHATRRLIVFSCVLLICIQVFIQVFIDASLETIVALQNGAKQLGLERVCWAVSELIGPQPRILTMVVIMLAAKSGDEATRWLLLRFFGTYLRWVLGMVLQEPRPSWVSDRVEMLHCPESYGLPSGHALLLGSLAASICLSRSNKWYLPGLTVWFVLMCIGRLYLGAHSIHDLLLGASLGLSLVYFMHDRNTIQHVQDFYLDQGFWFVIILLCFGVSASFGFAQLLAKTGNEQLIAHYQIRARSNGCHVPNLYDPLEGVVAVSALGGLLLSLSIGRSSLEPFLPKRILALLVFLIPSVWKAESQALLVEIDFPYHSQMFILGACNLVSVLLLFTTSGKTLQEQQQLPRLVNYGASGPLYGTVPLQRV